jgi:hypothetical protein
MFNVLRHQGNGNQNPLRVHCPPVRTVTINSTNSNDADEDEGNKLLFTAGGNVN